MVHLFEVWDRKDLLQLGQQFPQKDMQSAVVTRPVLDRKHLLFWSEQVNVGLKTNVSEKDLKKLKSDGNYEQVVTYY